MKKNLFSLLVLIASTAIFIQLGTYQPATEGWEPGEWSFFPSERQDNRRRAARLYRELELGQTGEEVEQLVKTHEWLDELVHGSLREGHLTLNTPLEIGAHNWVIAIEFDNGVVKHIDICTPDAPNRVPHDLYDFYPQTPKNEL